MICNFFCEYFFATLRIAWYNSALNFSAVACSGEKPRSSRTFPRVICVALLPAFFMPLLPGHPCLHQFQSPFRRFEFPPRHFAALFLKAMQHMDHVFNPRQIYEPVPASLILVPQLENARADRLQRSVVARPLAFLQLPKLKADVLSHAVRKGLQHLFGIPFPHDDGIFDAPTITTHGK